MLSSTSFLSRIPARLLSALNRLMLHENVLGLLFGGIALIYMLANFAIFPRFLLDDAYIAFRYADNLAKHGELTWNVGEDPVEGYTGVLLPVILAGAIRLELNPEMVTHGIGMGATLVSGVLIAWILHRLAISRLIIGLILIVYATNPMLYVNAFNGLETMLFAANVLASVLVLLINLQLALAARQDSPKRLRWLYEMGLWIVLLVTSLTRPEGVVFAAFAFLAMGIANWYAYRRWSWGFWLRLVAGYALPALVYFIWRMDYYGQLLPNTYYAKSNSMGINFGEYRQFRIFINSYMIVLLFTAFVMVVANIDHLWNDVFRSDVLAIQPGAMILLGAVIGGFIVMILVQYVMRAILVTNQWYRFYIPVLVLGITTSGLLMGLGFEVLKRVKTEKPIQYGVLLACLLLVIAYQAGWRQSRQMPSARTYATGFAELLNQSHQAAADYVSATVPPDEWLVIVQDAGLIPYSTGLRTVDLGLLNDETLVRDDLSPAEMYDYIFDHNPGVFVITSHRSDELFVTYLFRSGLRGFVDDPRFANYEYVQQFERPANKSIYIQFVYLRKDLVPK